MKKYTVIMALLFFAPLLCMENEQDGFKMVGPSRLKQKQIKQEEKLQAQRAWQDQKIKKQQALLTKEVKKRVEQLRNPKPVIPPTQSIACPLDGDPMYGESIFRAGPSNCSYPPHAIIHFRYQGHARYMPELEDEIETKVMAIMTHRAKNNQPQAAAASSGYMPTDKDNQSQAAAASSGYVHNDKDFPPLQ